MSVTEGFTTRTRMCERGHPSSHVCECHCCWLSHTYEADRVDGRDDAEQRDGALPTLTSRDGRPWS
jgi:hypothetical protein